MNKVSYNNGDGIFEAILRDDTGAKEEVMRCNRSDRKEFGRILKKLREKYGMEPESNNFLDLDNEFIKF